MKTLKAALPIFPGFYNTLFEPNEDHIIEDGRSWDDYDFDYTDYYNQMGEQCTDAIKWVLFEFGFDMNITFNKIWGPREYNFTNDAVLCNYQLRAGCLNKIKTYVKQHKEAFSQYLKETFTSCSGFTSFYSNQYDTWLMFINLESFEKDEIYLEHILNFILLNEKYTSETLYDAVYDRVNLDGSLKEIEDEEDFEEKDLGAIWSYTPILEMFDDFCNPRQLKLNL